MSPELILFAIKGLIRIGQQGNRALIDYAVDRPAPFPEVQEIKLARPQDALNKLLLLPRYARLVEAEPFKSVWDSALGQIKQVSWNHLEKAGQDKLFRSAITAAQGDAHGLAILSGIDTPSEHTAELATGLLLIKQWKPENEPISPLGRMVLAIAEVGLDYLAINPSILGVGTNGEKIIKSFAIALGAPLTQQLDAEKLGPQANVARQLLIVLAGAGLETLKAHASEIISEQHLATLVSNVLDPVIAVAKSSQADVPFQVSLQRMIETLAGPAAAAAMKTVGENPGAFLGSSFASSKAAGALVSTLLVEAAKAPALRSVFTDSGLLKLLSASLQLAADKPGLFVKTGDKDVEKLLVDLTTSAAKEMQVHVAALAADRDIDGRALAAGIASAAITAFGQNAAALIGGAGKPWNELAGTVAAGVLGDLAAALKNADQGQALKKLLSQEKLVELGRIVVDRIAAAPDMTGATGARAREVISALATVMAKTLSVNRSGLLSADGWLNLARDLVAEVTARPAIAAGLDPGLKDVIEAASVVIAGDKNSVLSGAHVTDIARTILAELAAHPALLTGLKAETRIIVAAVAQAMAADSHLLLSGSDWVDIIKIAVTEASANPARLFGLNYNDQNQRLAADVIGLVLRTLPQLPAGAGAAAGGAILKGELLREAMAFLMRAVSGTPEGAKKYLPLLQRALAETSSFVAANAGHFGSREWLAIVRSLTTGILDGKFDAELAKPIAAVIFLPSADVARALAGGGAR